jgi:hypothetical protein
MTQQSHPCVSVTVHAPRPSPAIVPPTPQLGADVADEWRQAFRHRWVLSIPGGKSWTESTKNLRNFLPLLADFADTDGRGRVGRDGLQAAVVCANLGCAHDTVTMLYAAAEATGLVRLTRSPKGYVNGYALAFPEAGREPNWASSRDILSTTRQQRHRRAAQTGGAR